MPTALFKLLTLTWVLLAVMASAPGCEESTDPSLEPPEMVDAPPPTTTDAPPAAAPTAVASAGSHSTPTPVTPSTPAHKAAEAGDVPSMLLLGRSHESLGQKADARKWYQRAADAGNEEAKRALAQLDAPPVAPATAAPATTGEASPTTSPTDLPSGGRPPSPQADGLPPRRVTTAPLPPGEPGKLRWIDIEAVLNYDDILSDGRMMAVVRGAKPVFVGRSASRDKGIVVAAMGPSEGDINELTVVIRARNRVDPGSSPRVAQAGAVAARVTADNVSQREILEWVTRYLQTKKRSEPIFRNGWRITVSGSAAEGTRDPNPHLGTAVMIEMKK